MKNIVQEVKIKRLSLLAVFAAVLAVIVFSNPAIGNMREEGTVPESATYVFRGEWFL